eukprot:6799-Heterococcus_DN1.PRE.2
MCCGNAQYTVAIAFEDVCKLDFLCCGLLRNVLELCSASRVCLYKDNGDKLSSCALSTFH